MSTPRERAGYALGDARMRGSNLATIPTADLAHILKQLDLAQAHTDADLTERRIRPGEIFASLAVSIAFGWLPVVAIVSAIRR